MCKEKKNFKIVLIELQSGQTHVYEGWLMPMGLNYLTTRLTTMGYDVVTLIEGLVKIEDYWDEIMQADLIGLSCITANATVTLSFADRLRKMGKDVVIGGAHPTFRKEESLEHANFVVRGEGFKTLPELVEAVRSCTKDFSDIQGLSWINEGEFVHNEDRPNLTQEEFADLPPADITLIKGWRSIRTFPVVGQSGCPYHCEFCSVVKMYPKLRYRSIPSIIEELKIIEEAAGKGAWIFFVEDNFLMNPKKHAIPLLQAIVDSELKLNIVIQARVDAVLEKENYPRYKLLGLMRRAGIKIVCIGMESVEQATLDKANKKLKLEQTIAGIKAMHDYDMLIVAMMIIGMDTDTRKTFPRTLRFLRKNKVDVLQLLNPMPLPGTPFARRMSDEGRVICKNYPSDWKFFNGNYVILMPKNFWPLELQLETLLLQLRFYSPIQIAKTALPAVPYFIRLVTENDLWHELPNLLRLLSDRRKFLDALEGCLPPEKYQAAAKKLWPPMIQIYALRQVLRLSASMPWHMLRLLRA